MDIRVGDLEGLHVTVSKEFGEDCMVCDGSDDPGKGSNPWNPIQAGLGYRPSFRDMLAGKGVDASSSPTISDLDVEFKGDGVQYSFVDGTPSIRFSYRIHDLVDAKLANSVIVRLLGRTIGYSVLLTWIRSLWNPVGEIALIDLDNGYYLV
ncbi:hypothetical protein V6N12_010693 [Hibiscus sabdariffa]|uniref:Uncharacterized protein n=1 Tax=Hibiscus sabdariffa TaxID=183260 RepID=A0ABR2EKU6_9ROSI